MKRMTTVVAATLISVACAGACAKKDETPAPQAAAPPGYVQGQPAPGQYAPPQGQYAPPQGQYAPQGAPPATAPYPTQGTGYPPAPAATPGAPAMATPGPLALPCQSDASCGLAHCNTAYGKCAFPCAGPVDCATGATCNTMTGLCLPGGTQ